MAAADLPAWTGQPAAASASAAAAAWGQEVDLGREEQSIVPGNADAEERAVGRDAFTRDARAARAAAGRRALLATEEIIVDSRGLAT